jgi:S-adenosylmethionine hydrolase
LYVDSFGNLITNISEGDLATAVGSAVNLSVHVGPLRVGPLRTTYADVSPGEIIAILGSTGMLEVAINQGNAAAQLRAAPGTIVVVR